MRKKALEILKAIEELHYWDMPVISLSCDYFADEIGLVYEGDGKENVFYRFDGCYDAHFNHVKGYRKQKPVKDMAWSQIPYFLQNVDVSTAMEEGEEFFVCEVNMFPLYLRVLCRDIVVGRVKPGAALRQEGKSRTDFGR